MSWVRVPPERTTRGRSFFLGKVTVLGVLCCFALNVGLTLIASFFLRSHLIKKHMYIRVSNRVFLLGGGDFLAMLERST